jgi:hypothetical protein
MGDVGGRRRHIRVKPADPELLIAYLTYAVEDVRPMSARSAKLLVAAIGALAEDALHDTACGASLNPDDSARAH